MCYNIVASSGNCKRNWKAAECVGERNVRRTNEGPRTECLDAAPSRELVLHNPMEHAEKMLGKEMINSFQAFSYVSRHFLSVRAKIGNPPALFSN